MSGYINDSLRRDTIRAMGSVFRHKWSLVSGATTAVHCLIIYGVVHYLYHRGMWHADSYPAPKSVVVMAWVHCLGILVAVIAAVMGIIVEKPSVYAVIALALGLSSFIIFVG
jgi:hypothetical protein